MRKTENDVMKKTENDVVRKTENDVVGKWVIANEQCYIPFIADYLRLGL